MGSSRYLSMLGKMSRLDIHREGEGPAEEGWIINVNVVSAICSDFSDALFQTMVKSSRQLNRLAGLTPKVQAGVVSAGSRLIPGHLRTLASLVSVIYD